MNRRILIIDDDANIRNLYSDFLSNSLSCRQDTSLTAFEVITADHGQEFYEHGNFGHNTSFNYEQVKVPFIVRWPDGKSEIRRS